jgi:methylenetetrahydrofolate reductase (NADPH)
MSPDTGPLSVATPVHEYPAHSAQRLCASFEFSPPKTEAMERTLWEAVTRLAPLCPTFFSVTYGAGGSTRQRTHDTVVRLKQETGIDPAAHLTCVGATRDEIDDIARAYWDAGIRHIVALRGDPPAGMGRQVHRRIRSCANAAELVAGLRRSATSRSAASRATPESTDSPDIKADLISSARSMPAEAMHQFFFEADDFLGFRDRAAAAPASMCRSCPASCRCRTSSP